MSQVTDQIISAFAISRTSKLNLLLIYKLFRCGMLTHLLNIMEVVFKREKFSDI